MCLHHQAEINRLTAEKKFSYIRTFKSAPGLAFTNKIWGQEGRGNLGGFGDAVEMMADLQLDQMLAELREGSEEFIE